MKIVMMARNSRLYAHRRLVAAGERRGHRIDVIDPLLAYMNITSRRPEVRYKGESLRGYDAVLPRIGASVAPYGLAVLRQFEMMGVWPLNESVAIGRARDKLTCLQLLAGAGIALPVTAYAHSSKLADDVIEIAGGAPVVIKLLEGTQGIGVMLGETHNSAKSVIEAFRGVNVHILVQEFIEEAGGADIRCFVIGNKVVAAMMRQGAAGDFRSNLHRGGQGVPVEITRRERTMAVRAARTLGLNVCGVDLLRSKHGPVVTEINASPGLEGIETVTRVDVARKIIEFIEKHAEKRARKA
ncbi:MAG TPA: 30S ribosomal protein S6--L-glutamate ligase [Gammaproteobacteria bacterium]